MKTTTNIILLIFLAMQLPCNAQGVIVAKISNKEIILNKDRSMKELSKHPTMVIGEEDFKLEFNKLYLYKKFPFFIEVSTNPTSKNITHLKDATETIFQDSGRLLKSEIYKTNNLEYYIDVSIITYTYQNNKAVYFLEATAYVKNEAFRIYTECLDTDYIKAEEALMNMLRRITVRAHFLNIGKD